MGARRAASSDCPFPEELSNVKGSWTVTSAILDGKPAQDFEGTILRVTSTFDFEFLRNREQISAGTYEADPRPAPRTIDVKFTTGRQKEKSLLGIYHYGRDRTPDFDALTICFSGL